MTVSTLLVCDDTAKADEIGAFLQNYSQINLTGASNCEAAAKQILELSPSVVWIELAPDPTRSLSLLGELRETYPAIQYVVSYETLRPDLVKSAMQLGAVEYIDPPSAQRLLPETIDRIQHKLNAAVLGTAMRTPASAEPGADDSYVPGAGASRRQISGVRGTQAQLEGPQIWVGPALILMLLIAVIYVAFFYHPH